MLRSNESYKKKLPMSLNSFLYEVFTHNVQGSAVYVKLGKDEMEMSCSTAQVESQNFRFLSGQGVDRRSIMRFTL